MSGSAIDGVLVMKLWRIMLLSTVAGLSAACVQDRAAPVEYHGNEVYKKEGRFDLGGNELPKYSADNPADQDAKIAEKYVGATQEYGVAAELDEVKTTDITHLNSSLDTSALSASAPVAPPAAEVANASPVLSNETPNVPAEQESFFARMKRNVNDMADTIDKSIKENLVKPATNQPQEALVTTVQPTNTNAVSAAEVVVSTAAVQPPLTSPASINVHDTTPPPAPQLQPPAPPVVMSTHDAPPLLTPRVAPEVQVQADLVKEATPAKHMPINDATDAMAAMDKAMEDRTAHLQPSAAPLPAVPPIAFKEQAKAPKAKPYVKAVPVEKITMEEEVVAPVPPAPMKKAAAEPVQEQAPAPVLAPKVAAAPVVAKEAPVVAPAPKEVVAVVEKKAAPAPATEVAPAPAPAASEAMLWPVKGAVISQFGSEISGRKNDGINIAAKNGDPIRAAGGGVVVYAGGRLKGYGNMVIIQHPNGYLSAYAHAKDVSVSKGDVIKRGQLIGTVGQSGGADKPQLHFALRKDKQPIDPQKLLTAN